MYGCATQSTRTAHEQRYLSHSAGEFQFNSSVNSSKVSSILAMNQRDIFVYSG